jgi:HAD superfamily hydrolase (TIGR01509 family)
LLNPRFSACIFDLDGVLINSEPLHLEALRLVFVQHGIPLPPDGFEPFIGRTDLDVFVASTGGLDLDELTPDRLVNEKHLAYDRLSDTLEMMPGVRDFIDQVTAGGLKLGLATSSVALSQRRAFQRFGLDRHFQAVVTADDVARTKPDPEPYLLAAEHLGCDPADCIVIEDSANGIRSAKGAGCYAVGLTSSFPASVLVDAGADAVVDHYQALARHLQLA